MSDPKGGSVIKYKTRILFILVDGIGDCCYPEYGGKTLFQKEFTPSLDKLAKYGANGMMDSFEAGYACGSDTAHLNIFGYTPKKYYKGRGAFETEGAGLLMKAGDIAFKCNFAYMDPTTHKVVKRRVDREFDKWGLELVTFLDNMKIPGYEQYEVRTKHATEHRIGLKVSGPNLSNDVTGTDPLVDNNVLLVPHATSKAGEFTALLVNIS